MIVYSNSCSFGAPQEHKTYSDHISEYYNATLINHGIGGSCNRRIIRSSLRDLIDLKKQDDNILVLIGLTFISRTELWQPWLPATMNDGHFSSVAVDDKKIDWSIHGLIDSLVSDIYNLADNRIKNYYKHWLEHFHPESEVTNLLCDLIMFSGWADQNKIRYLIFSNTDVLPKADKVGYDSPFISSLRQQVTNNKNIIDLWNLCFGKYALDAGLRPKDYDLYAHHGHPGAEAHQLFANFLLNYLKSQN